MKAIAFNAPGDISYVDVPRPDVRPTDVLLKVDYIGLCGSDLSTYRGTSSMVRYPVIPGHEISARVAGWGSSVPAGHFEKGERVTVLPYFNCGACAACRRGRPNACEHNHTLGVQIDGALAEYLAVPVEHVVKVSGVSATDTALIEPLSVGFHLATRARIGAADTVAVFGCGAVGLGAIAAAHFKGARVVGVDISDSKIELARHIGADDGINSANRDPVAELRAQTGGDGPSVVIEAAGQPSAFLQCLDSAQFTGRMGIVSYTTKEVTFNTKPIVSKELEVYGSRNALDEFPVVQTMIRDGGIPIDAMITRILEFEEVPAAFAAWNEDVGSINKIMVRLPQE